MSVYDVSQMCQVTDILRFNVKKKITLILKPYTLFYFLYIIIRCLKLLSSFVFFTIKKTNIKHEKFLNF